MIVEDDPMVCRINEGFLEKIKGVSHIKTVYTIEKAKAVVESLKPDLILLDVYFQREGALGLDYLKWLRLKEFNVDVILITADNYPDTIAKALRYGAVDYLIKPFRFERLDQAFDKYKKMKFNLEGEGSIKQNELDHILDMSTIDQEVDKINSSKNRTYEQILEHLKNHSEEFFTAGQIADIIGTSRITARRYLDLMEKDEAVELVQEYGSVGRPTNCYKIKL